MNTQRRETLARQLEAISEQANSVTRMIAEDVDCIEVLHHLQGMREALNKTKTELLKEYLEHWAAALVQDSNPDQCKHLLKEFPVFYESVGKTNSAVINHTRRKNMTTVIYFIPSINCGNCKRRIETWLSDMEGVQSVYVNFPTKQAIISFDAPATEETIKAFLAKVNYAVQEEPNDIPIRDRSCCG